MQLGEKNPLKHRTHDNQMNRKELLNMHGLGLDSKQALLNPTDAETEPE